MPAKILVVDDEISMCDFMEIMLSKEGYEVQSTDSPRHALELLRENDFDLVLTDLNMPEMSGIEVLKEIKSFKSEQDLIVMTAFASVDTAIEAMKHGATDYITKPFKVDEINLIIQKSISRRKLQTENKSLKKQLKQSSSFDKFIGSSEAVVAVKKLARQVAESDSTILIQGESGTGKDVIARAIHSHSPRGTGPFITINCAALPENLLESELFGHKRGSFTGAIKDKDGLFKVADGGTIFLDEIGNMSIGLQVKMLRVLEDKIITPVGETKPIEVDVRLIAATNADLEAEVKAGRFRADLFYRLNVIPLFIPPLRERPGDIEILARYFVEKFCQKLNRPVKNLGKKAMALLTQHRWPGNVRELENTLERAVLLSQNDLIEPADFPEKLGQATSVGVVSESTPANPTLESIEKAYIHYVMSQTEGKKSRAAKILGIDTSTLYRKLDRYNLNDSLAKLSGQSSNKNETDQSER